MTARRSAEGGARTTAPAFTSVSTWSQPLPPPASSTRTALLDHLAARIDGLARHRLRIAVDGRTAAGKTSFGHELAAALRARGRPTLRASLDDFKRPWREAHRYDRTSGGGYYRNAQDQQAVVDLLLRPAGPDGDGRVVLCAIDPLTQEDHREVVVHAPTDAVLLVDGVFALRPAYDAHWDLRVWLHLGAGDALARGVTRDTVMEGREEAERLHRDRYAIAEQVYITEVDPAARAEVVIDNRSFTHPRIVTS